MCSTQLLGKEASKEIILSLPLQSLKCQHFKKVYYNVSLEVVAARQELEYGDFKAKGAFPKGFICHPGHVQLLTTLSPAAELLLLAVLFAVFLWRAGKGEDPSSRVEFKPLWCHHLLGIPQPDNLPSEQCKLSFSYISCCEISKWKCTFRRGISNSLALQI